MKVKILSILLFAVQIGFGQIYIDSYRFASAAPLEVEYLVVAGGGGAGGTETTFGGGGWFGGGGGAGGLLTGNISTLQAGVNYNVSVGLGGTGGVSSSSPTLGQNGQNSVFDTFTAIGGGGGGGGYNSSNKNGSSGGSGGGGGSDYNASDPIAGSGTIGQGNNGGNGSGASLGTGGSGGGAGGSGNYAATVCPGGVGLTLDITGVNVTYSTGGDGGNNFVLGSNGAANTGDGGDRGNALVIGNGHSGGSGVVILRYPSTYTISVNTQPGDNLVATTTTVGSDKVTTFTSGTGNIQFN